MATTLCNVDSEYYIVFRDKGRADVMLNVVKRIKFVFERDRHIKEGPSADFISFREMLRCNTIFIMTKF